ncbi:MAG: hypothetical protein ACOC38_08785 [Promethearchaeia archaeon]
MDVLELNRDCEKEKTSLPLLRGGVLVFLLFSLHSLQLTAVLGEEITVFHAVDISLAARENYRRNLVLVKNAPHRITANVRPKALDTSDVVVKIEITKDGNGRHILYRGDTPCVNTTFTPLYEDYILNITNMGVIDEVSVNMTITQTGSAVEYSPLETIIRITPLLLGVSLLVMAPVVLLVAVKRR